MSADDGEPGHGTPKRYDHGTRTTPPCRCTPCRRAKYEKRRLHYRRAACGQRPTVDAGPVREHVEKLHRDYGLGLHRIAVLAGVSDTPVRALMGLTAKRPARRIRRETAAKLLAVTATLDDLPEHTPVDACGSRRRLQALVATGRMPIDIAAETGLVRATVIGIAHGYWPTVRAETARTIRDATRRLWELPPSQRTPRQRSRTALARKLAARHGWVPYAAWDDIDDPAATPQGVPKTRDAA